MNSVLMGGQMKRRRLRRRLLVALPLVAIAALSVSAAWLWTTRHDATRTALPIASAGPAGAKQRAESQRPSRGEPPPGIALSPDQLKVRFDRAPSAGVAFDLETGEVVWRRHALRRLPIASLTKIMTALIVVERTEVRERARIPKAALKYSGSGVGVLPRGKRVRVEALLHGMMLPSGNDAAIALAVHVGGSERRFARLMNRRAHKLGLRCTHFSTSYGLQGANRSCAADLAALSRVAMDEPRIARIVRRRSAAVRFPIKGGRLYVNNTNPLLASRYPGTIGLKTGFTDQAGRCYVAVVRRGGRTWGVVLLDSPDPAGQAKRLIQAARRAD